MKALDAYMNFLASVFLPLAMTVVCIAFVVLVWALGAFLWKEWITSK